MPYLLADHDRIRQLFVLLLQNKPFMFEFFEGPFDEITPSYVVVNCAGIGYRIEISLTTYSALKNKERARVFVHHIVREDAQLLYGFSTVGERRLFRALTSVSGIGANTARMMLSSMNTEELVRAVVEENIGAIKSIKGIGQKTAQRVVVELKDTLSKFEISDIPFVNHNKNKEEALLALQTLGFNKLLAERALDKLIQAEGEKSVEDLIRMVLKVL